MEQCGLPLRALPHEMAVCPHHTASRRTWHHRQPAGLAAHPPLWGTPRGLFPCCTASTGSASQTGRNSKKEKENSIFWSGISCGQWWQWGVDPWKKQKAAHTFPAKANGELDRETVPFVTAASFYQSRWKTTSSISWWWWCHCPARQWYPSLPFIMDPPMSQ